MKNMILLEQYFLWLMLYSVAGWVYESILCSITQKRFVNRGFLNGPYCPIYGCGALLDILILGRVENPILLFFLGGIITTVLEYLTSYAMEKLFHTRWWDYSDQKFQINGRVCLLGAVVFGTLSVVLVKILHPALSAFTAMIPQPVLQLVTIILLAGLLADTIITCSGFAGFEEQLKKLSPLLEKMRESTLYSSINSAYASVLDKLTRQQHRMIKAFPKLKSLQYNEGLKKLRTLIAHWKESRENQ